MASDQREHLANVCHIICTKMRHEVTRDLPPDGGRHHTHWQAGLHCAQVLWRSIFAVAASKAAMDEIATPVLFMAACSSVKAAAQKLLNLLWLEVQDQFTSKCNKYRNMKSRPSWSVLEALQYQAFGKSSNFGIHNPAATPAAVGTKPAANLQDFLEEVLALRFAIDWMEGCMQDSQEFLTADIRRAYKVRAKLGTDKVSNQLAELKNKYSDSFATMWTDDAEARHVALLASTTISKLEGPARVSFAATHVCRMLSALWRGVEPMLSHFATLCIARLIDAHVSRLPPPRLEERDEDLSQTTDFHLVSLSYQQPNQDTQDLVSAAPKGVRTANTKLQAVFRGYVFRLRHFGRTRDVALYCNAKQWPRLAPPLEDDEEQDVKDPKKRKEPKKGEATERKEESSFASRPKPMRNNLLPPETRDIPASPSATRSPKRSKDTYTVEKKTWPLPTADHRACADLFALYMYSMYRRRELAGMWRTICGAYERGMGAFSELMVRNPALRPMLESISAQLKRGSVVGYDKAFIAKQKKVDETAAGKIRSSDVDVFKRREKPRAVKEESQALSSTLTGKGGLNVSASAPLLGPPRSLQDKKGGKDTSVTEEYLTNYLKEMDGDDSQFKDISSAVIPLSTGTSPPRMPPAEAILADKGRRRPGGDPGDDSASQTPLSRSLTRTATGMTTPPRAAKPKLDVPFCLERKKPMWLPIKAHRFAAYRAKVLQLLPQVVLQQYIDNEKKAQYAACIKLLESATPGSLNVLNPTTLVNNKPLLVETVLQLIVGYAGLCLRNRQGSTAVRLISQVIDNMSLALRDLHPGHRTVLEAYLYDTAISVCYYVPEDVSLTDRAESFFLQASDRYLKLGHTNRYCKCCLRAAAVLHNQDHRSEAEYYTQQALNKLSDAPVSSLLAVCYHNLAVHTVVQQRISDSVAHVRAYVALLKQLPKLGAAWMQQMDNTQWMILKIQELWPQYQAEGGNRHTQHSSMTNIYAS